jgi:muramidase (phage lysozyme)
MNRAPYLVGAALAVALFLWARKAEAASVPASLTEYGDAYGDEEIPDLDASIADNDSWSADDAEIDYSYGDQGEFVEEGFFMSDEATMVQAFLHMIRRAEHNPHNVATNDDYRTFYGGAKFNSYADHPVATGELRGVALTPTQCKNAGFPSGVCVSTAAGAYQQILPTWQRVRAKAPRLPDFSPASQDEAAIRILDEIGALPLIRAGNIEAAIAKASSQWASLPGNRAKQNPKSLQTVLGYYNEFFA